MPWMQTSVTEQRLRFAEDFESGQWSMTELCERYGVTRADRLQVGGPLSGGGRPGDDRAKPGAARVPASDAGGDRGADPHRPPGVRMGSEEAPAGAPDASARDRMAGAQYGQRHPRAARQAPQAPASQAVDAPGSRSARDAATEPGVAGGLQGAVQDPRRAILLPTDGHRSLQPDAPCVPRPVVGEDRGGEARVPRPVPRGRPPRSDPDRQRDTVRVDWHPRPVRVERVVDAARHRPSTDSSGESPGERDP